MIKKHLSIILIFFFFSPCLLGQSDFIKTIYFKSNSSYIDHKYDQSLAHIAKMLASDSFGYLKIFGFADTKGSIRYNDLLSQKRAERIYNYLRSRAKFDSTAVYVDWLGESEYAYDLHFPGGAKIHQRCVDIWIQFYRKEKK